MGQTFVLVVRRSVGKDAVPFEPPLPLTGPPPCFVEAGWGPRLPVSLRHRLMRAWLWLPAGEWGKSQKRDRGRNTHITVSII